jgi:hypothetical protein
MAVHPHLLLVGWLGAGIPDGAGAPAVRDGPEVRGVTVGRAEPSRWRAGAGELVARPGSELVTFADGWADGFVGLLAGRLDVAGAEVTVVLPHGTVTGRGGADFTVRASLDGHAVIRVAGGEVLYQGDGGGAGRARADGHLRLGPDGVFRATRGAVSLPTVLALESVDGLLARLRTWAVKRSFKLLALEKRQANLRTDAEGLDSGRAARRLSELRARRAVVLAWLEQINEAFRVLEQPIVPAEDELVRSLEALGSLQIRSD